MARNTGTLARQIGASLRFLPCQAEPGMFKDELLVYVDGFDPEEKSKAIRVQLLVDASEVENLRGEPKRNRPVSGWLRVTLASEDNEEEGFAEVILPQPAQPVGESLLVDANVLRKHPES